MKKMERQNLDKKWADFTERLQYMKAMVDPRYLLESLGYSITNETAGEIRATCSIHGGDNRTAFRFNKKTGTWICFTHKCQEEFGNDVVGLIKGTLRLSFKEAVEYLQGIVGDIGDTAGAYADFKRKKERDRFIEQTIEKEEKPAIVNEDTLACYKPLRSNFFVQDGFTQATLDYFEIAGGYKDSENCTRDIIPIRNDDGELMAYSLRDIRRNLDDDDFKYILTKGFLKDKVLYNLHNAKKYGAEFPIIVVEGFKSVWMMYQAGIYNTVAVMGAEITPGQINLLCKHAMKGVVIMFDNDIPGITGAVNAYNNMSDKMDVFPVFITETDSRGKGLDPADLGEERLKDYLFGFYGE
jgi:DNA primase